MPPCGEPLLGKVGCNLAASEERVFREHPASLMHKFNWSSSAPPLWGDAEVGTRIDKFERLPRRVACQKTAMHQTAYPSAGIVGRIDNSNP